MTSATDRLSNLTPEQKAKLIRKLVGKKSPRPVDTSSVAPAPGQPSFCTIGTPGNFDSIRFRPMELGPPGPGQMQVKVNSYSLNFRDLMIAMGMYPATPGVPSIMGTDCSGEVLACGEGITGFKPGDEFFGLSAGHVTADSILDGCHFASTLNIMVPQAVPKPANISFEDAAGTPTVFATAYFGLKDVARLQPGENVLIHTATGGVGMSAIQIAHWLDAKIYATAGSSEKRDLLQSMGIDHPMDSRSTDFADQIMDITHGEGVDVILNTLSGDAVAKGLEILRPFGRFIQVDKKDIAINAPLPLGRFQNGLSFTAIDIGLFVKDLPKMQALMHEIADHLSAGHFQPPPHTTFPIAKVGEALNYMSRAQHIGKIVLTCK